MTASTSRRYLISPIADFLMVGGLGLLLIPLIMWLLPESVRDDVTMATISPVLAGIVTYHVFAINYPHFAFSYMLAYRNMRFRLYSPSLPFTVRARYWFALIFFPLAYAAYCLSALLLLDTFEAVTLLGLLVNLMFLTVGWHYCKQCFGIMIVLSALKEIRFSVWQRRWLLANALAVWLVSWVGGNLWASQSQFWGLNYETFTLAGLFPQAMQPQLMQWHGLARVGVQWMGAATLCMLLLKGWREKKRPSLSAIVGYFLMYPLILIGHVVHPFWFWIVPAIHSLQYFPFVIAYKRAEEKTTQQSSGAPNSLAMFAAVAVAIGATQFSFVPHSLDALITNPNKLYVPMLFMALCHLFVNIHHYFIDNVIWRKENKEVGRL